MGGFYKELREGLIEIQHVLNDENEPIPRSKANLLCEAMFDMVNEYEHEPEDFEGWNPWREIVYSELGQLYSMPSRNHMKVLRKQRNRERNDDAS